MTKPAITFKSVKTTPLTQAELDTNFQNLRDATFTLTADTGGTQVVSDLNGVITLVAGSGVTLSGDNDAKTLTITASASDVLGGNDITIGDDTGDDTYLSSESNYLYLRSYVETIGQDNLAEIVLQPTGNIRIEANGGSTPTITMAADLVKMGSWQQEGTSTLFPTMFQLAATTGGSFSVTPAAGMMYFDTTTNKFRGYDGTNWVDLN